ncbi:hypothetical protein LOTGIDRAFT_238217 [Lottia gigantea]|uniref:Uncharacterized protein n=1 Tax=Lottia gigantea TaxID=225164 RepID=V4AW05_LOTGI|nr:hypothetical protein LOTGIDRAFT_238217 [Lottia gigantea]ESP01598.1 hypothetical protein LOTGIDRAFT_238217 [Lottia gigantea]
MAVTAALVMEISEPEIEECGYTNQLKVIDNGITNDDYLGLGVQEFQDVDLFCKETVEDLDQVWYIPDEARKDAFKIKPYQLRSRNTGAPFRDSGDSNPSYQVGDPPKQNPYINYLVQQFQNSNTTSQNPEIPQANLPDELLQEYGCVDMDLPIIESGKPPSPLLDRLTLVDSFNEVSMNDVIIFRDESLIPYLQRSPRSSPTFSGSNNTSPRSISPVSDHVVPGEDDGRNRILRSCEIQNDQIVPEYQLYIEE